MGFLLQLRVLLWKNLTLKRRNPWVVAFELFIPLVLFIILLCIRKKQPAYPIGAVHFTAKPLPSAGVLAVMQAFCTGGVKDENGFVKFPNATVSDFLEQLNSVAHHNNFFEPGFSVQELDHLPNIYRSIIEDPAAIHDAFAHAHDFQIDSILKDNITLYNLLLKNLSMPAVDVDALMNAKVNISELYHLVFGYEPDDYLKVQHRWKRDVSGTDDTARFINPAQEVEDHVIDDTLKDFTTGKGLLYQYLSSSYVDDFSRKVILHMLGLQGSATPDDTVQLIENLLLSYKSLHMVSCDPDEFQKLLIPASPNDTAALAGAGRILCNLTKDQLEELSKVLISDINKDKLVEIFNLQATNTTIAIKRLMEFVNDVEEFVLFEKNLQQLSILASKMPQDACSVGPLSNVTIDTSNSTDSDDSCSGDGSRNKLIGLMKIWLGMQRTLCGQSKEMDEEKLEKFVKTRDPGVLGLTQEQTQDLMILVHALYSNMRVLYAPNDTQVDEVIDKANSTFMLLDTASAYARKWLNVSAQIREYLELNTTAHNLQSIREMQYDLRRIPVLRKMSHLLGLDEFVYNTTVPSVEFFLHQLDEVDIAACSWLSLTDGMNLNIFHGFNSEEEIVDYFLHEAYGQNVSVLGSVIFTNVNSNGRLPPHVIYKLRQNASLTESTKMVRSRYWYPGPRRWHQNYYKFGFVWIQDVIERAVIDVVTERDVVEPGSYIQEFPYPCYMDDTFLFMIEHVMPLCLTVSWVYTVAMLVQSIVYEKEQRLKEVMKMMGLNNSVHWLAWFLTSFTQMSVTMGILTIILKEGSVLQHSNPWIIFMVLEIFAIATISFSFLVSVLYSKAKLAAACAGIVYFLGYVPCMYVAIREEAAGDRIPVWTKILASTFSTTAFGLGAKYFGFYEREGVGVHWDNMYKSPVEDDDYNLFWATLMMLIDALFYGLLTWYIEHVHPGSYGLPKPWYFPFTRSYWMSGMVKTEAHQCSWRQCCQRNMALSVMEEDQACAIDHGEDTQDKFESEPDHLPLGVCIDNLTKVYKTGKLAVNKLSMNLYEGQITSFLGHNGAGKTTTMSILTGLFPPTAGTASVYGFDIRTNMEEIRKSLGMCPQHNVLFEKMTVEEHLWFYATLKGISADNVDEEMDIMIRDLGLPSKRQHTVDSLSGGMKRKLSVAIAFVAGSRTVILDEPTAGVDPYARRAIWDLLVKYKQGRTILLSTHHMDEADILGDRIAIVSHGQMKCCGSSLFLKSTFGEGYHLTVVKKHCEEDLQSIAETMSQSSQTTSVPPMPFSKCCEPRVTRFIQRCVPSAYLKAESLQELHYILPFEAAKKGQFEKLFNMLDPALTDLEISSYGVMDTSLEEVFLKVTERAQKAHEQDNAENTEKENSTSLQQTLVTKEGTGGHKREASDASILSDTVFRTDDLESGLPAQRELQRTLSDSSNTSDLLYIPGVDEPTSALPTQQGHARMPSDASLLSDIMMKSTDVKLEQIAGRDQSRNAPAGSHVAPSYQQHRRHASDVPLLTDHHLDPLDVASNRTVTSGGNAGTITGHRRTPSDVPLLNDAGAPHRDVLNYVQSSSVSHHQRSPSDGSLMANLLLGRKKNSPTHRRNISTGTILSMQSCDGAELPGVQRRRTFRRGTGPKYVSVDTEDDSDKGKNGRDPLAEGRGSYVVTGYSLQFQQFYGVIRKRFAYTTRNWKGLFSQILLPALFVCVAMTVALTAPQVKDLPEMVLSPAQYYNYTQPRGNFIPVTIHKKVVLPEWNKDAGPDKLMNTMYLPCGTGATCLLNSPYNKTDDPAVLKRYLLAQNYNSLLKKHYIPECESVFARWQPRDTFLPRPPTEPPLPEPSANKSAWTDLFPSKKITRYYPQCKCADDKTGFVCQADGYQNPPSYQLVTGDILQDIQGQNESEFYLFTTDIYRLHRYGAVSLGNVRDYVPVDFGKDAPTLFRKIGVRNVAKTLYNNKGYHAMPVFVNALNNVILRANLPKSKGDPAAYGITAINHPMNNTNNQLNMEFIMQGSDVLIAIFIIVAMSFVPASFVLFLVYERSIKAKHLQFVCGMNRVVYWIANYVWDMCNYLIPSACCVIILKVFDIPAYVSSTNFPAVMSLFLLYGWSITPMMYPASFVFNEPSTAYICLIVVNLFIGITCIVTSFLLELFQSNPDLARVHNILKNIFVMFPNYSLGRGLMDIAFNEYQNEYYFKTGQYGKMKSPFAWHLTVKNLVAMAGMGLVFFLITLLCEFNFFKKPRRIPINPAMSPTDEDVDVAHERKRVLRGSGKRDLLRVENLTKVYVTRKLGRNLAVDRLCLGVREGECFGLLGVNGAGKTTTFKMLTGDLPPTGGDAYLNRNSIVKDMLKVQQNIGYCPQFDALYDELTAREHLMLYARLRGVPCKDQTRVVNWALKKLGLTEYADKLSGTYSGGNKRKLSTAIALIGHPPVIFLDEPTTGMDPHSRRFLWDLIHKLIKKGRSVILTSHSMEECEALCTRLAIMVNGSFKCLGSIQHLKTRFGEGYTVSIRVKGPNFERQVLMVEHFMNRHFPRAILKDSHHNQVQYELPTRELSLSTLFSHMETMQNDLDVEDYSVSQNTLDNVFINFVKNQTELLQEHESPETEPNTTESSEPEDQRPLLREVSLDSDSDNVALQIDHAGGQLQFHHMDVAEA